MSPTQEVCVDASLAMKVVVTEPGSDKADALFDAWANEGKQLIAPAFFEVETDSILRQKVALRKELTPEQAEAAFAKLRTLPIQQIAVLGQRQRAWEMAADYGFATVYDDKGILQRMSSTSSAAPPQPLRRCAPERAAAPRAARAHSGQGASAGGWRWGAPGSALSRTLAPQVLWHASPLATFRYAMPGGNRHTLYPRSERRGVRCEPRHCAVID